MPIPKAVAALVAVVLLGACSGDDPTPEELRRARVEERLGDTFPPAQVTCIIDGLDEPTMIALDENAALDEESAELATYSFVVRVCSADPDCSEWTQYASRGSYKVHRESRMIMIQTDGAPGFNPVGNRGATLNAVTGSLRNFSGGDLNWTIEARCPDDLVCGLDGCESEIKAPNVACVKLRETEDDNDEGTN